MGRIQIQELNHRHIALAEFLLLHPSATLGEVARAVGLTSSWVSTVVNSELFREYLTERHKEVSHELGLSLHEKVHGVAHAAVEKLGRMLDDSVDPEFVLAVADRAMHKLGMGPTKSGPSVQVNTYNAPVQQNQNTISSEVLAAARENIYRLAGVTNGSQPPHTQGVHSGASDRGGEASPQPALVYQGAEGSRE